MTRALLSLAALVAACVGAARGEEFDTKIAPLLARRCLGCHNRTEKKGGLDLSSAKAALAGGESGPSLVAGKPDESLLWERIAQDEMPPKQPLPAGEKKALRDWIAAGGTWGTETIDPFRYSSDARAGYDWWSLQPIRRPEPPPVRNEKRAAGAIDRFILAELEAKGLAPSSEADRRTLIRRLSFDLLGLPPDPSEVERFLADSSPEAYARLVERLLDSPHYGERWGRHWLDIVRFGESQGFERDKLRPTAWPYRDWVIAAFNDDMPYDEFIRLQLAGDVLRPGDPRGIVATGFLVAGPWDEVGQSQQSAAMKMVVRQDELEDLIGVTCQTFLGLTVHCARCHDHKFDPIPQEEYYRIAADFAGVRHGERDRSTGPVSEALAEQRIALQAQRDDLHRRLNALDAPIREQLLAARRAQPTPVVARPEPLARWEFAGDLQDSVGALHGTAHGTARVDQGRLILDGTESFVVTAELAAPLEEKTLEVWVTLDRLDQQGGGAISVESASGAVFDAIVFGEREAGQWVAGSNGFVRTQSFQAPVETEAAAAPVQMVLVYGSDRSITAYRNGQPYGTPYTASSLSLFEARKSRVLFGLRHSPAGGNRHLSGAIERAALYPRALTADEVASLAGTVTEKITTDQLLAAMPLDIQGRRRELVFEMSQVETHLQLLSQGKVYAVVPGTPDPTWELKRGNPQLKGERITPGAIRAFGSLSPDFGLTVDAGEPERRIKLAEWITHPDNPLTARVIVNRLWQYHFGSGLVDTPNDFGFNGGRPSHPALLDWLAAELMSPTVASLGMNDASPPLKKGGPGGVRPSTENAESGSGATPPAPPLLRGGGTTAARPWSLKHLHRLIVLSATYRQSSQDNPTARKVDAGNRLLWRRSPQRLEAEALRDALLSVAGALNPQMGGGGFQEFRTFTFNSQFYEMLDKAGWEFQRRTIYRTWVRSGRSEFLDVFDCPDPSATAPKRAVTTTPLQALALLNNSFTLRMSDVLADRVRRETGEDIPRQVGRLYALAFSRPPSQEETQKSAEFITRHGLAPYCRVLFNSNEFLYVE